MSAPHEAARPDRRAVLRAGLAAVATMPFAGCSSRQPADAADRQMSTQTAATRMPVLFVGHGSPMNAIEDNRWSRAFSALAADLPRPRAILAISAHWYVDGVLLTGGAAPRTIHDFGGFPQALFEVQYPAPGHRDLATRVARLLREHGAALADDWGLDHGTWSVLRTMYPAADVPVVQLSIDRRLAAHEHLELARSLEQLRGDGVLVVGSGNITHNLRDAFSRAGTGDAATPAWARDFDAAVCLALQQRDTDRLVSAWPDGPHGRMAHPYPDHWWPLLYAYGASNAADVVSFPIEGFDMGSLSMRAVRFG